MKALNLEGQRFGRLVAIRRYGNDYPVKWLCRCDCGNETIVTVQNLRYGSTKSCGCYVRENMRRLKTTHGDSETRLWNEWRRIRYRCFRKENDSYDYYGGRGITMCDEWKESYECFKEWALANGYRDDLTIDRIDVNGNYCPENCRWITNAEQQKNKRNNVYITYKGETRIMADWAKLLGIDRTTLRYRIKKLGWSIEKAFTTPVRNRTKKNCLDTQPEMC